MVHELLARLMSALPLQVVGDTAGGSANAPPAAVPAPVAVVDAGMPAAGAEGAICVAAADAAGSSDSAPVDVAFPLRWETVARGAAKRPV